MIFYLCNGRQLAGTQADAKALDRDFVQIDVPTDKAGLMAFINELYERVFDDEPVADAHGDDDRSDCRIPDQPVVVPQTVSYSDLSTQIDEIFQNLPLPHQLTLAAVALETARVRIR